MDSCSFRTNLIILSAYVLFQQACVVWLLFSVSAVDGMTVTVARAAFGGTLIMTFTLFIMLVLFLLTNWSRLTTAYRAAQKIPPRVPALSI